MAKIIGIGGIFFKSKNPSTLGSWYRKWLNLDIDDSFGGTSFQTSALPKESYVVWSPFKETSDYFDPSEKPFMINFIVDDVEEALEQVKQGDGILIGVPQEDEFGKFGWFIDPEGNKIELWQPK